MSIEKTVKKTPQQHKNVTSNGSSPQAQIHGHKRRRNDSDNNNNNNNKDLSRPGRGIRRLHGTKPATLC